MTSSHDSVSLDVRVRQILAAHDFPTGLTHKQILWRLGFDSGSCRLDMESIVDACATAGDPLCRHGTKRHAIWRLRSRCEFPHPPTPSRASIAVPETMAQARASPATNTAAPERQASSLVVGTILDVCYMCLAAHQLSTIDAPEEAKTAQDHLQKARAATHAALAEVFLAQAESPVD